MNSNRDAIIVLLLRIILLSLIVLCTVMLISCFEKKTEQDTVKIGLIATLSGGDPPEGAEMDRAAEMAVEEINRLGGIPRGEKPVPVELIKVDDKGNPEGSIEAARNLIYKHEVAVFVGPQFSSNAIPVAALADEAGVVMFAPMSTNEKTTMGKEYVYRIPFTDSFQAQAMADFATEDLELNTFAVLYNISDEYSRGLAENFMQYINHNGGSIVCEQTYTYDTSENFTLQLQTITEKQPEALYLPNYTVDAKKQAVTAKQLRLDAVLLGGDGWSEEQFSTMEEFQDSYLTCHRHPDLANAAARQISGVYTEKFNKMPDDVFFNTYDAFLFIFTAIEQAETLSSEAIKKEIDAIRHFEGTTGPFHYRNGGDPDKSVIVVKLSSGELQLYTYEK
jgi:branched-chain amino acid transport system substrate-binding protein